MDEVIFFRQPSDASLFLIFNLPLHPHPLTVDETALTDLCDQIGLLYKCALHYTLKEGLPQSAAADDAPISASASDIGHPAPPPPLPPADAVASSQCADAPPFSAVQSVYAHVHYFSVAEAQCAMRALRERFRGSGARFVWSRRRDERLAHVDGPRVWSISFAKAVEVRAHTSNTRSLPLPSH